MRTTTPWATSRTACSSSSPSASSGRQLAEEAEKAGEARPKLKADGGPRPRREAAGRRPPITDSTEAKGGRPRGPSCSSSALRASARPRSPSRSPGRWGAKYVRISLGGVRDEADIRGHRRTYVGAMPGRIIQGMKQAGTKNPVFLLDEVDKLGVSTRAIRRARCSRCSIRRRTTRSPITTRRAVRLAEVLFIATANFIQNIPGPLLDRMEVVEFSGYTEREKLEIAKRYLVPRQLEENGLNAEQITLSDEAIAEVVTGYTRESGVRQLERELGKRRPQGGPQDRRRRGRDDGRRRRRRARAPRPAEGPPRAGRPRGPGRRRDRHVLHADGRRHHVRRGACALDGRRPDESRPTAGRRR